MTRARRKRLRWTASFARKLIDALVEIAQVIIADDICARADGGLGSLALEHVLAAPAGVERDAEIERWSSVIAASPCGGVCLVRSSDAAATDAATRLMTAAQRRMDAADGAPAAHRTVWA